VSQWGSKLACAVRLALAAGVRLPRVRTCGLVRPQEPTADPAQHLRPAGLVRTPYSSGEAERDQGISKAGSRRVRAMINATLWQITCPERAGSKGR
jgi:transposase